MALRHRLGGLPLLCGCVLAGLLAEWNYRSLPEVPDAEAVDVGHVSIIVPARDEANRLPALLSSLRALRYHACDVTVVDDASIDRTADLARETGARVISVAGPPLGWTGKSHACQVGAEATQGEWLLFTDADTIHAPASLGRALSLAAASDAGLVSLLARQHCLTVWEKMLLPYAYALYFSGAWRVNRAGGTPVANGQYMLFRRPAYERIGGHASVRHSVIEDVALARACTQANVNTILVRGERELSVRMYGDLQSLWSGFAKNAARFAAASPRSGIITALAGLCMLWSAPTALRVRTLRVPLILTPIVALYPWYRRFGTPHTSVLAWPAAIVFQAIAFESLRLWAVRDAVWKGRRY